MSFEGLKIGFAMTGSFCTIDSMLERINALVSQGAKVYPIISEALANTDTRFGNAIELKQKLFEITSEKPVETITESEQFGPKTVLDILVVAPCTGNTLSKMANAITDTSVTMAAKAHLRNGKPVVISISTNDALGANAKNLGILLNRKNVYFVPFGQDDPIKKCTSLIADASLLVETIKEALKGKQLQPLLV